MGLETAFPALYTGLVRTGVLSLERLVNMMSHIPRKRFGIPDNGDVCVYDLEAKKITDPSSFLSKGRSTPFSGRKVYGENIMTVIGGKIAWRK